MQAGPRYLRHPVCDGSVPLFPATRRCATTSPWGRTAPQILRLPPGGKQFEIWSSDPLLAPPGGGGAGLDGLAFLADGCLIVDTYMPGELFRVDVNNGKAGKVTQLTLSRKLVVADAIRPLGHDTFLIIESGGRLDRMVVKGDTAEIETLKEGYDILRAPRSWERLPGSPKGSSPMFSIPAKKVRHPIFRSISAPFR